MYETASENRHLGVFVERHPSMNGEPEPDHDGKRVATYERVLRHTLINDRLGHIFSRSEAHYNHILEDSGRESLLNFNNVCTSAGC